MAARAIPRGDRCSQVRLPESAVANIDQQMAIKEAVPDRRMLGAPAASAPALERSGHRQDGGLSRGGHPHGDVRQVLVHDCQTRLVRGGGVVAVVKE
jgi:hypothetical protein